VLRLAGQPAIAAPAITLEGADDGVLPARDGSAYGSDRSRSGARVTSRAVAATPRAMAESLRPPCFITTSCLPKPPPMFVAGEIALGLSLASEKARPTLHKREVVRM
jgi:hypothetical protein